jgi:predicted DNA-binding protein (MmcQ/YjbR family)
MDIDIIRNICLALAHTTEDIKWGNDLCFCISEKMYCVTVLDEPLKVSIKVTEEEFDELTAMEGIVPAPYVARHKWILVEDTMVFNKKEWQHYIAQSYELVKARLPGRSLVSGDKFCV